MGPRSSTRQLAISWRGLIRNTYEYVKADTIIRPVRRGCGQLSSSEVNDLITHDIQAGSDARSFRRCNLSW